MGASFGSSSAAVGSGSFQGLSALDNPAVAAASRSSDEVVGTIGMPPLTQSASDSLSLSSSSRAPSYVHSSAFQRPPHSAHPSFHSDSQAVESLYGGHHQAADLTTGLGRLQFNNDGLHDQHPQQQHRRLHHASSYGTPLNRFRSMEDVSYAAASSSYPSDAAVSTEFPFAYGANRTPLEDRSFTPTTEYSAHMDHPFYSAAVVDNVPYHHHRRRNRLPAEGQAFDRRLNRGGGGFQQEQEYPSSSSSSSLQPVNPLTTPTRLPYAYDIAGYQAAYNTARMNALSSYYPIPPLNGLSGNHFASRAHRDRDLASSQVIRSPLLEEFRANSKGNKRYELKVCSATPFFSFCWTCD